MKNFGKLSINPDRLMKNEELLNLRGGNMWDAGPKVEACSGKKDGDACEWVWEGHGTQYGTCRGYAPTYELHCSDLN